MSTPPSDQQTSRTTSDRKTTTHQPTKAKPTDSYASPNTSMARNDMKQQKSDSDSNRDHNTAQQIRPERPHNKTPFIT
jgi:hypothetical protein